MTNANREKGLQFERDLAQYFRAHGISTAERQVVGGWRSGAREHRDQGDLRGIPGFCVQAKNLIRTYPHGISGKYLRDTLVEVAEQCAEASQVIPLLIEKRYWEHGDIGWSHVHLPARMHMALLLCRDPKGQLLAGFEHPVRVALTHIIEPIARYSQLHAELNGLAVSS